MPPQVVDRVRARLAANDQESFLAAYSVFARGDRDIVAQLETLPTRLLAVTGSLDAGSTPAMTHALAAAVPDGTAELIAGARHLLPLEQPDALADALNRFTTRSEPEESVDGRTTAALG